MWAGALIAALTPRARLIFQEKVSGYHRPADREDAPPRSFRLELEARIDDLSRFLDPASPVRHRLRLTGRVALDGLAQSVPVDSGRLELSPYADGQIRYCFRFTPPPGSTLHFEGQRQLALADPWGSAATLIGEITQVDSGRTVTTCRARSRSSDLARLLRSLTVRRLG